MAMRDRVAPASGGRAGHHDGGRRPQVAVLNSYNIPPRRGGRDTLRLQEFLRAMAAGGWEEGRDFDLRLVDIEERPAMDRAIRELIADGVDLIQSYGTPNSVAAAEAVAEAGAAIPIVYCGAHPEGIGDATMGAANATGKIMALPFTASYKSFRFLRRFLPQARTVWTVFYEDTVFVTPAMRDLHRDACRRAGRRVWLSGSQGPVGFRTLAGLGEIVGIEYRELVFSDAAELAAGIEEIADRSRRDTAAGNGGNGGNGAGRGPASGVLMNYNELLHCPAAFDTLLRKSAEIGIPTIFNNNAQAAAEGLLAGIAADWGKLGRQSGELAASILDGAAPRDFPREVHGDQVAWLNLDTARRLGLDLDPEVKGYFDLSFTGKVETLCM
jgi:ABC-type uncharacterized transport system substrate-binding protein